MNLTNKIDTCFQCQSIRLQTVTLHETYLLFIYLIYKLTLTIRKKNDKKNQQNLVKIKSLMDLRSGKKTAHTFNNNNVVTKKTKEIKGSTSSPNVDVVESSKFVKPNIKKQSPPIKQKGKKERDADDMPAKSKEGSSRKRALRSAALSDKQIEENKNAKLSKTVDSSIKNDADGALSKSKESTSKEPPLPFSNTASGTQTRNRKNTKLLKTEGSLIKSGSAGAVSTKTTSNKRPPFSDDVSDEQLEENENSKLAKTINSSIESEISVDGNEECNPIELFDAVKLTLIEQYLNVAERIRLFDPPNCLRNLEKCRKTHFSNTVSHFSINKNKSVNFSAILFSLDYTTITNNGFCFFFIGNRKK